MGGTRRAPQAPDARGSPAEPGRPSAVRAGTAGVPRVSAFAPALGYALIWLFLIVFLVYPLGRIFYDAFTDETGRFTVAHFVAFAHDGFYLRSLGNSLLLGLGTVACTSVLGFAIARALRVRRP